MLSKKWVVYMWLCPITQLFCLVSNVVDLYYGRNNTFESDLSKRRCCNLQCVDSMGEVVRHAGGFLGIFHF